MPLASAVGKNKYLLTLRDSFAMIMPLLIIGSMFTLVANFPIPAWIAFLKATTIGDYTLSALIAIPASCTVSMMALFIAFNVGYNFAEHIGIKDRASAGIVSLASWLILMPQFTEYTPDGSTEVYRVASLPLGWIGAKGVFIAIVVGFLSGEAVQARHREGLDHQDARGRPTHRLARFLGPHSHGGYVRCHLAYLRPICAYALGQRLRVRLFAAPSSAHVPGGNGVGSDDHLSVRSTCSGSLASMVPTSPIPSICPS